MLPDVINGQAHCQMPKICLKMFKSPRGNFADIFLLIVQLKLHRIRDVCTLYVGALV